jgi:murein DD-endopeptidase MepM/ murein hydrolase activator NlpD
MSYRTGHQSEYRQPQDPGRPTARQPVNPPTAKSEENGYTLVHAGKQVRFGPVAFWIVVGTVTTLGMWSAATATYFAFRDDVLTRLIARQAEMRGAAAIEPIASGVPKPSPISDTAVFVAPPDREARLESRAPVIVHAPATKAAKILGVDNVIVRLQNSLDQVERRQLASLTSLEDNLESRQRRMRGVFTDLGLDIGQLEAATPRAAMGGPFVPVKLSSDAGAFDRQLYRINISRSQVERLNRTLALVPYRKPVIGEVEFTSGFGVRSDPFLGRPAMHTGLDFRAASGDPVRATANGKVASSGWAGGYGRMVEIDHGNGLSTRYGHLSEINVKVGDVIKIGQVIGAVGSTGRSTGPHLHYETRIDGEAVDPQKFLRAGVRLSAG